MSNPNTIAMKLATKLAIVLWAHVLVAVPLLAAPASDGGVQGILSLEKVVRVDGSINQDEVKELERKLRLLSTVLKDAPISIEGPANTPFELVVHLHQLSVELKIRIVHMQVTGKEKGGPLQQ